MRAAYPAKFIFIISCLGIYLDFLLCLKKKTAVVKDNCRKKHDIEIGFYSSDFFSNSAYTYFKGYDVVSYLSNIIKRIYLGIDFPRITTIIRRSFVLPLMGGAAVNFQDCSSNQSCSSHITYWLFLRHQRRGQLQFVRHPAICINNSFAIMPKEVCNIQSIYNFLKKQKVYEIQDPYRSLSSAFV